MIVLGEFNIHINDENDNEAGIFVDTITALHFNQHMSFPTHQAGNILDLVFTETCNSIEVMQTRSYTEWPYISQHSCNPISTIYTKEAYKIQKA